MVGNANVLTNKEGVDTMKIMRLSWNEYWLCAVIGGLLIVTTVLFQNKGEEFR